MADQDSRLPIRQIHNRATTPDDDDHNFRPTGVQGTALDTVHAQDVALHDEFGDAYTTDNPLPVTWAESEDSEVVDYQTTGTVVKDAVTNHDYTVTALKTFVGDMVWISASGKIKVEVKKETAAASATFNNVFVAFNSTSEPNVEIPLHKVVKQVAGAKVRISITNKENASQDVYSTLLGTEK